jgi:photosystem II stability/assembly factor-like uncharacterized protein
VSRSNSKVLLALFGALLLADSCPAQQETVFMSVLSSRRHRIGASDNPVVGLYVSTDRGLSWAHRGWREYIRVFYTEAGAGAAVWSACGNGVLRSTDNGTTWRITTGWDVTEVLKVRALPSDPNIVHAATAYGIIRSTDGGDSWKFLREGFHRRFTSDVIVDRGNVRNLFAASEEGVYRSSDGGEHWTLSALRGKTANVIIQDPLVSRRFWAGTEENGVYRSDDGGDTWRETGKELRSSTVYALAASPGKASRLYAGTFGGGVVVSTDGGTSWSARNEGLKNLNVHALLVLPSNPDIVLAGTLNGGLYRSADGGTTWVFNSQEDSQVWGLSVRAGK